TSSTRAPGRTVLSALGHKPDIAARQVYVYVTPKSGHWLSALRCPLCARRHYAVQQSIAPIGACTAGFSPVVGAGCKAPAHSHHILPLAQSVLPHPAHGR